jgi:hypothetical protein
MRSLRRFISADVRVSALDITGTMFTFLCMRLMNSKSIWRSLQKYNQTSVYLESTKVLEERRQIYTRPHGVISHTTVLLIATTERTSNSVFADTSFIMTRQTCSSDETLNTYRIFVHMHLETLYYTAQRFSISVT